MSEIRAGVRLISVARLKLAPLLLISDLGIYFTPKRIISRAGFSEEGSALSARARARPGPAHLFASIVQESLVALADCSKHPAFGASPVAHYCDRRHSEHHAVLAPSRHSTNSLLIVPHEEDIGNSWR